MLTREEALQQAREIHWTSGDTLFGRPPLYQVERYIAQAPEAAQQAIADALLAVQTRTAGRCAGIAGDKADECAEYSNIVGRAASDDIMLSIRHEFGLEPERGGVPNA